MTEELDSPSVIGALERSIEGQDESSVITHLTEKAAVEENSNRLHEEEKKTRSLEDEVKRQLENIKRAEAAGQYDVALILRDNLAKLQLGDNNETKESKAEDTQPFVETHAFVGLNPEAEEDRERFNEITAIADKLFEEEKDQRGEVIGLKIRDSLTDADREAINEELDNWSDKYDYELDPEKYNPEPEIVDTESFKKMIQEINQIKDYITRIFQNRLPGVAERSDFYVEVLKDINDLLTKDAKDITQWDLKTINYLVYIFLKEETSRKRIN